MDTKGLNKADQIYQNQDSIAKELKSQGKKIMGYFCAYVPLEMITAAGLIPHRITGNVSEPISEADAYIETIMCPFIRNCFDQAIKGYYSFLEGFIVPHSCDNVVKVYDIWKYNIKPEYSFFLNVPHTTSQPSMELFKAELNTFKKSLEGYIGNEISAQKIKDATILYNKQRGLIRDLYELRKQDPPPISGTEVMKTMISITKIPVEDGNQLLEEVIIEIKGRKSSPCKKLPRVLLQGPEIDDIPFIEIIENSGANVVIDDICMGTKSYWFNVEDTSNPLDGIAHAYLNDINCLRTYRQRWGSREEDLENRFGHLLKFAQDYQVKGALLFTIRYCDNYEFDIIDIKDYLENAGIPSFVIEVDYSLNSIQWMKTRIQAFLEMIS